MLICIDTDVNAIMVSSGGAHVENRQIPMDYDSGSIKRSDYMLRLCYYGLQTKIYLIEPGKYAILLLNYQEQLDIIKQKFDNEIRMVGNWVTLTAVPPENYLSVISPMEEADMICEGAFLTNAMMKSLLVSRFPTTEFQKIHVSFEHGVELQIVTGPNTTITKRKEIQTFLYGLHLAFSQVEVEAAQEVKPCIYISDVMLACTDQSKPFSVRDAEFWFDHAVDIFNGTLKKEQLRFYTEGTKCYLNFSVWPTSKINIRSNLILYDTVYLSLPINDYLPEFLEQQHLTCDDFESMVAQKKLVVFLPNTESRYNSKLIDCLYAVNPDAIVSKRGINALLATYFTRIEQAYLNCWQGYEEQLRELHMKCCLSDRPEIQQIGKWLIWPIQAKGKSKELLNSYSPMMVNNLDLDQLILPCFKEGEERKNAEFEFQVNGDSTQIASALQATYFPFQVEDTGKRYSDEGVALILNSILNGYLYPEEKQQMQLQDYKQQLQRRQHEIQLLHVDNSVPVTDLLYYSQRYRTTETLKHILETLTQMPGEEQEKRIREYNHLIVEIGKEKIDLKNNVLSYILSGAGMMPIIGTPISVVNWFIQILKDLGVPQRIREQNILGKIKKGTATIEQEVYLLDRLSRVARLQL